MARQLTRAALLVAVAFFVVPASGLGVERLAAGTPQKTNPLWILPFLAAQEQGLWKAAGLEVEWVPFDSGTALTQAMAAASLQMAMTAAVSAMQAITRGLPAIIVADMGASDDFLLWVAQDSPVRDPRDLKGMRIGVTRTGSVTHAFGRAVAKAVGLDIKIVATGGTAQTLAAIKAGAIAGSINSRSSAARLKYQGEIRELVNVRDYLPKEWADIIVLARRDFVNARPEETSKVIRVLLAGADFVMKNRSWSVEMMKKVTGYPEGLAQAFHPYLRYGRQGHINQKALENILGFLVAYSILPKEKAPAADDLFTNKFLQ